MTDVAAAIDPVMLRAVVGDVEGFDGFVHPADEMMQFAAERTDDDRARVDYLRLGRELMRTVDQITTWAFAGRRGPVSVLEFACGYGRNLRHLVHSFGAEHVTASDIDPKAMAFVTERFGVSGRLSQAEPEALTWDERFDLIIVPSLFSHLPAQTFGRWVRALHGLLTDRGVLAFSVHGAHLLPDEDYSAGIVFNAVSEALGRLEPDEYGTSFVTDAYVSEQVAAMTGGARHGRIQRGFWDFQDLHLVVGPAAPDPADLRYERPPMGHVDALEFDKGTVSLSGWAHTDRPRLTLRVRAGHALLHETDTFAPRRDVAAVRGPEFLESGFALTLELPVRAEPPLLVVEAQAGERLTLLHAAALPVSEPTAGRRASGLRGWRSS
jgi:SAM-dependent methyltransferase